jgi:hypothetical protein
MRPQVSIEDWTRSREGSSVRGGIPDQVLLVELFWAMLVLLQPAAQPAEAYLLVCHEGNYKRGQISVDASQELLLRSSCLLLHVRPNLQRMSSN